MASGSDLKNTLGSFLRTTLDQVGVVKDAVERQTRSQIDHLLLQRRRKEALTALGEELVTRHKQGILGQKILGELAMDPIVARRLHEIEDIDAQLAGLSVADAEWEGDREAVSSAEYRPPSATSTPDVRVWRPNAEASDSGSDAVADADDDLTAYMHEDDVPRRP